MEIKKFGAGEPELLMEFADRHKLKLEIRERGADRYKLPRYFASFPNVEVMRDGMLSGGAGNGSTPDEAASDYALQLAGRRVAIDAYKPNRREIDVPNDFRHEVDGRNR